MTLLNKHAQNHTAKKLPNIFSSSLRSQEYRWLPTCQEASCIILWEARMRSLPTWPLALPFIICTPTLEFHQRESKMLVSIVWKAVKNHLAPNCEVKSQKLDFFNYPLRDADTSRQTVQNNMVLQKFVLGFQFFICCLDAHFSKYVHKKQDDSR